MLHKKPKMVFCQACQGSAIAYASHDGLTEYERDGATQFQQNGAIPLEQSKNFGQNTYDILVSYAAFIGQKSFRTPKGSWYIQALCETFKESYNTMDVLSMITDVHNIVRQCKGTLQVRNAGVVDEVEVAQCSL